MRFRATPIPGVVVVVLDRREDGRGHFMRTWCRDEFAANGLGTELAQCSASHNRVKGTLRGMHWQARPHEEEKLVRVTRGSAFDVAVDLRPGSPTYRRWYGLVLRAEGDETLFVPKGCAHGFLTLEDDTDLLYQISAPHVPTADRGFRWDDASVAIDWPAPPAAISARDQAHPPLEVLP